MWRRLWPPEPDSAVRSPPPPRHCLCRTGTFFGEAIVMAALIRRVPPFVARGPGLVLRLQARWFIRSFAIHMPTGILHHASFSRHENQKNCYYATCGCG